MAISFNEAQTSQTSSDKEFALIPDKTVAPVRMSMRGIKTTKAGDAQMLDLEFVVTEGPHAKRRMWGNAMITSNGSSGHDTAVSITMRNVRGYLESAYGINPSDETEVAIKARTIADWPDLDGLEFLALIGIEKDKTGNYSDKNVVRYAITPDNSDYAGFKPAKLKAPKKTGAFGNEAPVGNNESRPSWAQ
jgi:hypothetical protein